MYHNWALGRPYPICIGPIIAGPGRVRWRDVLVHATAAERAIIWQKQALLP